MPMSKPLIKLLLMNLIVDQTILVEDFSFICHYTLSGVDNVHTSPGKVA